MWNDEALKFFVFYRDIHVFSNVLFLGGIIIIKSCHRLGFPWITPFIHCAWQVFLIESCVRAELFLVNYCWLVNTITTMWRDLLVNVTYQFVFSSPAVSCMSCTFWMILAMEGKWPYRCCFMEFCFQNLFDLARNFLIQFLSRFVSKHFFSVHVVHPYISFVF